MTLRKKLQLLESLQNYHHKRWRGLFLTAALLVVITMMMPKVFGLQGFTQWGGMYVDRQCVVRFTGSHREYDTYGLPQTWAHSPKTFPAWFRPMHNQQTCVAWARQHFCALDTVNSVYVTMFGQPLRKGMDICSEDLEGDGWFAANIQ